jgi:hypothetical protein
MEQYNHEEKLWILGCQNLQQKMLWIQFKMRRRICYCKEDNCNSVSAKKKKMSPVKNEKKTDDDVFDTITEGDLKKKCRNMWWRLSSPTLKMRMYSSPFVVAI